MLGKSTVCFLLAASITCFGQVTTIGGYATTSGPAIVTTPISVANAPLISTPDIALPGSGPAVGVPLSNTNVNDSRVSTGPSIANPNAIVPLGAENNTVGLGAGEPVNAEAGQPAAPEPFEFGIQQFGFEPAVSSYGLSLGEIARKYRNGHQRAVRTFTNDNIARLSAIAFQPGPLSSATRDQVAWNAPGQPAPAGTLIAENRPSVLPQSDRYSETVAASRPVYQAGFTAGQQRHAVAYQTVADQSAPNAAETSSAASNSANLPQTGSHLPLFLLIGGLGVAGGTLSLLRR